jgi:hypothetical protein
MLAVSPEDGFPVEDVEVAALPSGSAKLQTSRGAVGGDPHSRSHLFYILDASRESPQYGVHDHK